MNYVLKNIRRYLIKNMEEKILGREKCDTQTARYNYFYKKDRKQTQARLPEGPL